MAVIINRVSSLTLAGVLITVMVMAKTVTTIAMPVPAAEIDYLEQVFNGIRVLEKVGQNTLMQEVHH